MAQANKSERLMNLVICLLVARGYVPKSRIREVVGGYGEQSDEAFERMFERDKEELREVGIPIETGSIDPFGDEEPGYRIRRQEFELPDIHLEPDEAAAVGLASRVWHDAYLAEASSSAVRKLRAVGVDADAGPLEAFAPRVSAEPAFWRLWEAVRDRREVHFSYRASGGDQPMLRHLQPWSVLSWRGRWYVVGHDVDRDAPRMFRLSRISGEVQVDGQAGSYNVPEPDEVRQLALRFAPPEQPARTARLRVRQNAGYGLRRRATEVRAGDAGWDDVAVPYVVSEALVDEVTSYGADVVVVEPAEVRAAVIERLRAVVTAAAR